MPSKPLFNVGDIAKVEDVLSAFHGQLVQIRSVHYCYFLDSYSYLYSLYPSGDNTSIYVISNPMCFKRVGNLSET
jgi:hypothetical protein